MILDLPKFLTAERPYWAELTALLDRMDAEPHGRLGLAQLTRLHYLYQRCASALARLSTFSAEPRTLTYLEALVARAYAECHPNRAARQSRLPLHKYAMDWIAKTLPQTFRRQRVAFQLALALTLAGVAFGSLAISFDSESRSVLMPFQGLMQSPAERVKQEEASKGTRLAGHKDTFSAQLMTHNIQVSLITFALGATWGVGSTILLFYNGVILGAVATDYIRAGYTAFLLGWLLPHGVVEIPAILVAGQAGFVLASALVGWGSAIPRRQRLRAVSGDLLTLAAGSGLMLVWAGLVEAFLSQYHYPVLPYSLKIAFGAIELMALSLYYLRAGRTP